MLSEKCMIHEGSEIKVWLTFRNLASVKKCVYYFYVHQGIIFYWPTFMSLKILEIV